jgi:transposase
MGPYSMDLRRRVVEAVEHKEGSLRQVARRFCVSVTFITRLVGLRRQTGSLVPRPHGGGHRPALDEAGQQRLRQLLQEQPDATLEELAQRLGCGRMAVWRTLRKLKITRKKKTRRADERGRPDVQQKRQAFCAELADLDPEQLVFVDEMGATTAMARTYGRAPKGERVYGSVPGQWQSMTLISGLRLGGVLAPWAFPGATDTAGFQTYAEAILAPALREGDVVIWDNLKPHQDKGVIEAVEQAGARVLPAPPWSPDLVPIEKMFSKVKEFLRSAAARAREALVEAMGQALDSVCPPDILGWFKSCGLAGGPDQPASEDPKRLLDRLRAQGLCATQT